MTRDNVCWMLEAYNYERADSTSQRIKIYLARSPREFNVQSCQLTSQSLRMKRWWLLYEIHHVFIYRYYIYKEYIYTICLISVQYVCNKSSNYLVVVQRPYWPTNACIWISSMFFQPWTAMAMWSRSQSLFVQSLGNINSGIFGNVYTASKTEVCQVEVSCQHTTESFYTANIC